MRLPSSSPAAKKPESGIAKLALGTAQLGLRYGIANRIGKPAADQAVALLRAARAAGVAAVDTARDYGDAEELVGRALGDSPETCVVTKLSPLDDLAEGSAETEVRARVDDSVERSCLALGRTRLDALLLHRVEHRTSHGGALWRRLLELKAQGRIAELGVSVYSPDEARAALQEQEMTRLQIPFNALDWRWKATGIDALARGRKDLTLDARSALLQGLLAADAPDWDRAGFDGAPWIAKLESLSRSFDRESRADLCLAYARAQHWIARVVVGVETQAQLTEAVHLFQRPVLNEDQCARLEAALSGAPVELLNPSLWRMRG